MNGLLAAAAITFVLQSSSAWVIGQEREVDQGTYMTLQAQQDGWRIWRVETQAGVKCKAAKSAIGLAHAVPLGLRDALYGPAPRTEIVAYKHFRVPGDPPNEVQLAQNWFGTHGYGETQFRAIGERFFQSINKLKESRKDLKIIEINNVSWQYPSIYRGRSEISAQFDLSGIDWAEAQVLACYKIPEPE